VQEVSATIFVSKKGDYFPYVKSPMKALIINGTENAVMLAFQQLVPQTTEPVTMRVLVPESAVGGLIGTGGQKIAAAKAASCADISIRRTPSHESVVFINGTWDAVNAATRWLLTQQEEYADQMRTILSTNYGGAEKGADLEAEIFLFATDSQTARIIGHGGRTVRRISELTRVKLDFDRESAAPKVIVKLTGCAGDVHQAHLYILKTFMS
jgi:transcription antitermination factor NusA-like protein